MIKPVFRHHLISIHTDKTSQIFALKTQTYKLRAPAIQKMIKGSKKKIVNNKKIAKLTNKKKKYTSDNRM